MGGGGSANVWTMSKVLHFLFFEAFPKVNFFSLNFSITGLKIPNLAMRGCQDDQTLEIWGLREGFKKLKVQNFGHCPNFS